MRRISSQSPILKELPLAKRGFQLASVHKPNIGEADPIRDVLPQRTESVNNEPKPPVPPFDPLTLLAKIKGGATISTYQANQVVFSQDDPANSVFYIDKGEVKLLVLSQQGKEAIVAILGRGDFFGEGCLAGQTRRMAQAAAIVECKIMRLEKAAMIGLLHNEPEFCERFMSHLLTRNIRVEADLVDQLFNSSEKRLARLLLILARFGKEGASERIIPKIRQEALAEMIGTTRSRVNFFMNKFRKLGFIEYNGHLKIHRSLLDVVLHDDPRLKS